jgi:hypothetical protein
LTCFPIKIGKQVNRWVRAECSAALIALIAVRDGRAA